MIGSTPILGNHHILILPALFERWCSWLRWTVQFSSPWPLCSRCGRKQEIQWLVSHEFSWHVMNVWKNGCSAAWQSLICFCWHYSLYSLPERHILENYKSLTFYSMNSMISMYSMSHSSHSLPTSKLMWLTRGICRSLSTDPWLPWLTCRRTCPPCCSIDRGPPRNLFLPAVVLRRSEHANRY